MMTLRWFLRRLSPPKLPRPVQKYVGIVHCFSTKAKDDGSVDRWDQYWILTELAGKRRAEEVGFESTSPFAIQRTAEVKAWLSGGPVPPLGKVPENAPDPKPRKSRPAPKKTDNVIVLSRRGTA